MAKKKAKAKKGRSAPKAAASTAVQGQPTPAQPMQQLPPLVEQQPQRPSFDVMLQYLFTKIQKIYTNTSASQNTALNETLQYLNPMYANISNVLSWLQNTDIRSMVMEYVRLAETIRFYRTWATEMERTVERVRKSHQRNLDIPTRQRLGEQAKTDKGVKVTNDAVDAQVRIDPVHMALQELQDDWEYLGYQLANMLDSMQTDMMVQSSVWTQREIGLIRETSDPRPPQV